MTPSRLTGLADLPHLATQTYQAWREDRTLRLGAGLAFYALFAVVPLLALTAALAEWLFGSSDVQEYFSDRLAQVGMVDPDSASEAIANELARSEVQSVLGIIGLVSLLFAASIFFVAFTDAINVIWKVPVGSGIWDTVQRRLIAFLMVLVTGGVLIAGLALSAVAGAAKAFLPGEPDFVTRLADVLTPIASWASLALALALLFRFLTPVRVRWPVALFAGLITAVLLVLGTTLIGWYLRTFGGSSVAGAFGAVLATLSWIYYEAQILLGGVQFMKVLTGTRPDAIIDPEVHGEEDHVGG